MTRHLTAFTAIGLLVLLLIFDGATSTLNAYKAPSLIAWGSGAASAGAHCAALPQ